VRAALALAITLALALLMYRAVERPCARLRRHLRV
jgi:peptidoglycan/LPS O-acetylase OafA/YrhL